MQCAGRPLIGSESSRAPYFFSMPQQIVIAEQLRIAALLTDERVDELIVAQGRYQIGDVYLGTVENVLPGIDAAFVNIGESEKNGFIHDTDLGPLHPYLILRLFFHCRLLVYRQVYRLYFPIDFLWKR